SSTETRTAVFNHGKKHLDKIRQTRCRPSPGRGRQDLAPALAAPGQGSGRRREGCGGKARGGGRKAAPAGPRIAAPDVAGTHDVTTAVFSRNYRCFFAQK